LTDKGASWVYGEGEVIVTGLYNAETKTKIALNGSGGKRVKGLLLNPNVTLVGTNIQYDLGWLCYEHKLKASQIKCGLIDVAIAEASIDEYQLYTLDALAWKYLKERKQAEPLKAICEMLNLKGDFRKYLKRLWILGYEKEIKDYVISDADQPVRIWEKQLAILTLKPNAKLRGHTWMGDPVYNEDFSGAMEPLIVNFKLIKIVLGMKQRGVRIDMEKRKKNYEFLKSIQEKLQIEFDEKYSLEVKKEKTVRISKKGKIKESETTTETHPVNFNSSKQLAALFDKEKVPYRLKIRIKSLDDGPVFAGNELWEERKRLKDIFNGVRIQKGQLVLYVPKQYASRTNNDLNNLGYVTTCNPNIDKKALDGLKKKYSVAKDITNLKQVTSIIDKFLGPKFDRFIVKHGEDNYRIHADFKPVGARRTGRFSSANPNFIR
jgi:DNA polymerase I-like protein with 3'-5' exonuclease and polymerase domains